MIAEAGLAALWLAAALAGFQLVLMVLALRGRAELGSVMRRIAIVQGVLTLVAFGALLWVFARTDLSVALVFENSHSAKPWLYKVAGTWGNHEGSMLLWVTVLSVAGAFLALLSRRTGEADLARRARRPGGAGAGLLRLPADRFQSLLLACFQPRSRAGD